jgi:hypothetical protein
MIRIKAVYIQQIQQQQVIVLKNNIYNIDKGFDYSTVKAIVLKSVEKLVKELKEEALKNTANIINDVVSDFGGNDDPKNVNNLLAPPSALLKLKIKNTTQYLN